MRTAQRITLQEVLDALQAHGCRPRRNGKGSIAHCPCHDDRNPSLSITESHDGKVLIHCHAGCPQDDLWRWVLEATGNGTRTRTTRTRTAVLHAPARPAPRPEPVDPDPEAHDPARPEGLTLQAYAEPFGFDVEKLKAWGLRDTEWHGIPAVGIPYWLFDPTCYDDPPPRSPDALRYRVGLTGDRFRWQQGTKPMPYGLWRKDPFYGTLILVEGESDTHAMWHAGLPAIGIPGASSWKPDWWELLETDWERVLVWVEDDAGVNLLRSIVESAPEDVVDRIEAVLSPRMAGTGTEKDPAELWRTHRNPQAIKEALGWHE